MTCSRCRRTRPTQPNGNANRAPNARGQDNPRRKMRAGILSANEGMGGLGTPAAGNFTVAFAPPSVLRRQTAAWGAVQAESVDVLRHEPFDYQFRASRHLLIASERVNR